MFSRILLFLFVSVICTAQESNTYLLFKNSFTVSQLNTAKNYIKRNDRVLCVSYLEPSNTNYILLTLSDLTGAQKTAVNTLITNGKIMLWRKAGVCKEYDKRFNTYFDNFQTTYYFNLPGDFEIVKSS